MIFVDSNIPMYLVGASHPNKDAARALLEQAITRGERLVADAEVLQEILHRYVAINRLDAIQPAFDALLNVVDHVYPVDADDMQRAKSILLDLSSVSARDAVHVAIMLRYDIDTIMSSALVSIALVPSSDWHERSWPSAQNHMAFVATQLTRPHAATPPYRCS